MAENKLHTGVWVRQTLRGKREVRISFIPDDFASPPQYTIRPFDEGEKSTWVELLGDPKGVDIDAGITMLRFNQEGTLCNATWLPNKNSATKKEIFHVHQKPEPEAGGHDEGGADYLRCMDDNAGKSFIEANAACLGQWLV
jgi:hypothetical protein